MERINHVALKFPQIFSDKFISLIKIKLVYFQQFNVKLELKFFFGLERRFFKISVKLHKMNVNDMQTKVRGPETQGVRTPSPMSREGPSMAVINRKSFAN